jgi:GNAT superfamily N-acetyltransferase
VSLYAEYILEREGLSVIETLGGFVSFKVRPDGMYIQDVYVRPGYRKGGVAAHMADKVADMAKEAGLTRLIGSVDDRANGAKDSDLVLRAYGMLPYTTEGHITYYSKELP